MIRKIINACAQSRITQNLNSDVWILSMTHVAHQTEVILFDRKFTGDTIKNITFQQGVKKITPLHEEIIDEYCTRVVIKPVLEGFLYVSSYTQGNESFNIETYNPYHLETDMLKDDEVNYLRKIKPGFEVVPNNDSNAWQCMCSYVNKDVRECQRCGRTRHENLSLDLSRYQKGMVEQALKDIDASDESLDHHLMAVSQRFRIPLHDVRNEYNSLSKVKPIIQNEPKQRIKKRQIPVKKISIIAATLVLVFAFFSFGQPLLEQNKIQNRVDDYIKNGDFDAARVVYLDTFENKKSRESFYRIYFKEMENEYQNQNPDAMRINDPVDVVIDRLYSYLTDESPLYDDQSMIEALAQEYALSFVEKEYSVLALKVVTTFLQSQTYQDFSIEIYESVVPQLIADNRYDPLVIYGRKLGDPITMSEAYIDYIVASIEKNYLPHVDSYKSGEHMYYYRTNEIFDNLISLLKFDAKTYLNTAYEVLYKTVSKLENLNQYELNQELNILYNADYKDSRERFEGEMDYIVTYTVKPSIPVADSYVNNPFLAMVSSEDDNVTIDLELIKSPGVDQFYEYYIYELDLLGIPVESSEQGTLSILLQVQMYLNNITSSVIRDQLDLVYFTLATPFDTILDFTICLYKN